MKCDCVPADLNVDAQSRFCQAYAKVCKQMDLDYCKNKPRRRERRERKPRLPFIDDLTPLGSAFGDAESISRDDDDAKE